MEVDDHHLEEVSAVPVAALDKILAMLGDLSDRLNRVKVSRRERADKHRKDSTPSSPTSALEAEREMNIQALKLPPSLKRAPNDASLVSYFGARRHYRADVQGADLSMGTGTGTRTCDGRGARLPPRCGYVEHCARQPVTKGCGYAGRTASKASARAF